MTRKFTRRDFGRLAGAAVLAAPFMRPARAAGPRVVVIGAGGAVVAGILARSGAALEVTLAEATLVVVLVVFALVNLALVLIKRRGTPAPDGVRVYPIWLPATGFLVSTGFLALQFLR